MSQTRLVIVDDNAAMRRQVTALLPAEFHPVASLSSGDGLAVAIAEHHPDIVVLDITLPGANGIELASRLRATPGCPKIVFLTVHDDPDYLRAALEAGAAAYVVKARLSQDLVPALTAVRESLAAISGGGFAIRECRRRRGAGGLAAGLASVGAPLCPAGGVRKQPEFKDD